MASREEDTFDPNMEPEIEDSVIQYQHKYDKVTSIYEVIGVEEFVEEMEYETWCCKASSWNISIKIVKVIPFRSFSLYVSMRRVDLSDFIVGGILVIWFLNTQGKKCPVPYRLEVAVDGREEVKQYFAVDDHFRCLLREDDYLTFPDDVLIVKAQLFVKNCCGTDNPFLNM